MNGYEATSALGEPGIDKETSITFESLSAPLVSVLNGLAVPFGFLVLGLPSLALPDTSPLDAPPGVVFPYSQIHRDTNGSFVLEISSNFYLLPPHQLALDFEYQLFENGWEMPDLSSVEGRENFRRVTTDGETAARLALEAIELFGAVPGQIALLDLAVACEPTPGEPPPPLPDTAVLEELLDEARWQFLVSLESQGRHVSETHVSQGAPVHQNRDDHAAHLLIEAGWGIVLGGDQPGFEIHGDGNAIAVLVGDDFVELTIRLKQPSSGVVREHLAAVFHALSESARTSRHGTAFFLEEFVVTVRRQIRGLQPEGLLAEVESFQFEVEQFEGRLVRMLAQLG